MRRKVTFVWLLKTKGFRKWRRDRPRQVRDRQEMENIPAFVGADNSGTSSGPRRDLVEDESARFDMSLNCARAPNLQIFF